MIRIRSVHTWIVFMWLRIETDGWGVGGGGLLNLVVIGYIECG